MSIQNVSQINKDALERKQYETVGYLTRYVNATKNESQKVKDLVFDLLNYQSNYLEDGAIDYESLFEQLIKYFMIAENMNDLTIDVSKQKKVANQLDMLLWFFRSIQDEKTMATLHLYDAKGHLKESRLNSYHSFYREKAEIAEAAAAIKLKYRNL